MSKQDHPDSDSISQLQQDFAKGLREQSVASLSEFIKNLDSEISTQELIKLIAVELEYRRSLGELMCVQDFYSDFPQLTQLQDDSAITRSLDESTEFITEIFTDQPTEKTRQLIHPGDKIDDFELLTELGKGSFATVFLARQISMQRLVALKVSVDHGMEAQTLAQLDHPNIVRVFDQRKADDFNLQLLYMQYLEGGTLLDAAQWLFNRPGEIELSGKSLVRAIDNAMVERGASPNYDSSFRQNLVKSTWDQAIFRIGHALAEALDYAHGRGVLHRDIKPANVLIGSDCTMKLADFNISTASSVVGTGKFGGSLAYMSPEQIRAFDPTDDFSADHLDEGCDVYSLGVMLIQLLQGSLPFSSATHRTGGLQAMAKERESDKTQKEVASLLVNHSPLLQSTLLKCIAPDSNDRHASAAALATQLKIGLDPAAEQLLYPDTKHWSHRIRNRFFTVSIVVALVANILAAAFVTTFHLFDTVPDDFHDKFMTVQTVINCIAFPLAAVIFGSLTYVVHRVLRAGKEVSTEDQQLAISRNLAAGHLQSTICGLEWIVAGILYPLILTLMGVSLQASAWINFIASHTLAGVAITTLTFFAVTWFSVTCWLPALLKDSISTESVNATTTALTQLLARIPIYQMLAGSIPLLAVVLLVIFSDLLHHGKYSLTVISIFGLVAIPLVLIGGNKIRTAGENLLQVLRS